MNQFISSSDLKKALDWRYAVKRFDPALKIPKETLHAVLESLRLCPSSYGLQPWKFIVITDAALRTKLRAVSWNQGQVEECSHYVVLTHLKTIDEAYISKFVESTAAIRGQNPETLEGYRKMMMGDLVSGPRHSVIREWAARQVYIAMGFLMQSAALLGVDACPMEGISPSDYDRILGLEDSDYQTVATVALGYRSTEDGYQKLKKSRFNAEDIIEFR